MGLFEPRIEKLKARGDVEALAARLDRDSRDRLAAVAALVELGGPRTVRAAVELLKARRGKLPDDLSEAYREVLSHTVDVNSVQVLTAALLDDGVLAANLLSTPTGFQILRVALRESGSEVRSELGQLLKTVATDRGGLITFLGAEFLEVQEALDWVSEETRAELEEAEQRRLAARRDEELLKQLEQARSTTAGDQAGSVDVLAAAVRASCRKVADIQHRIDSTVEATEAEYRRTGYPSEDELVYNRMQLAQDRARLVAARDAAKRYAAELARSSPATAVDVLAELMAEQSAVRECATLAARGVADLLERGPHHDALASLLSELRSLMQNGDDETT